MNTLVTGAGGFIASHLVEKLLSDGHRVLAIDTFAKDKNSYPILREKNSSLKCLKADVSDAESVDKLDPGEPDWIFHLAGKTSNRESLDNPGRYFDVNVNGTFNILEKVKNSKIKKFIYIASSAGYSQGIKSRVKESDIISPDTPYALTKFMAEQYVLGWGKIYRMPVVSLRLFSVYGPANKYTDKYGAVFTLFMNQLSKNQAITVNGDGNQTRDYLFVSDAVTAMIMAAKSNITGETFNVGTGKRTSINQIVNFLGGNAIYPNRRKIEPSDPPADISKIKKLLGWAPRVVLQKGIAKIRRNY